MASGLLSLKWNNHRSTFFHVLSSIRSKESYCDATLACDGRFYPVHKLVLSTCSEYFEQMFERTQCKHPVIVLKDIRHDDLEALMNYMYVGEVNVLQERLAGLIKAAECLKIKGLAVPDEDPLCSKEKRNQVRGDFESPHAKRKRREEHYSFDDKDRPITSRTSRVSHRDLPATRVAEIHSENSTVEEGIPDHLGDGLNQVMENDEPPDTNHNAHELKRRGSSGGGSGTPRTSSQKPIPEVSLDEHNVKTEPPDIQDDMDSKETLHTNLGLDLTTNDGDSLSAGPASVASGSNEGGFSDSNALESTPQSVEDVVAQALPPTSSSFQGNSFSLWEGEGSLQNFPTEGFSGENSQGRPMVCDVGEGEAASENSSSEKSLSPFPITCEIESYSEKTSPTPKGFMSCVVDPSEASSSSLQTSDQILPSRAITALHQQGASIQFSAQRGSSVPLESSNWVVEGLQCSLCDQRFSSIPSFNTHLLAHPPDAFINCPICGVKLLQKDILLSRHIMSHTEESSQGRRALTDEYSMSRKRFACSLCPYRAFNRSNLVVHTRMHTGEKPFACPKCPYRANHKGNLVTHMRTHGMLGRQFPCLLCNKTFTDKKAMNQHMVLFHPPTSTC